MSNEELLELAEEQTALRRVATLVAQGVAPQELFAAVVEEIGVLLPIEYTYMGRYEPAPQPSLRCRSPTSANHEVGTTVHPPVLGGDSPNRPVRKTATSSPADPHVRIQQPTRT